MSKVQTEETKPGLSKGVKAGLAAAGLVAVLAAAAVGIKLSAPANMTKFATGTLAKMSVPGYPTEIAPIKFLTADGKETSLADFKGQVVVLNLWATWCGPCKVEMPTLGKLQASYEGKPVHVMALSVDRDSDLNLAKAEIAANQPLTLYRDPGYKLAFALKPRAEGFPTTIIIDRKGRERARMTGPADWNAPEVKLMIDRLSRES